jgi:ABC-type Mn2+/Zn2+ transport system permease subunit
VAVAVVSGVAGLVVSFYASTATGATIVLVAMGVYLLTLPLRGRTARL